MSEESTKKPASEKATGTRIVLPTSAPEWLHAVWPLLSQVLTPWVAKTLLPWGFALMMLYDFVDKRSTQEEFYLDLLQQIVVEQKEATKQMEETTRIQEAWINAKQRE